MLWRNEEARYHFKHINQYAVRKNRNRKDESSHSYFVGFARAGIVENKVQKLQYERVCATKVRLASRITVVHVNKMAKLTAYNRYTLVAFYYFS